MPALDVDRRFPFGDKSIIQQVCTTELIKHRIGRDIFCPVTGAALDVRTCVTVIGSDGESVLAVLSPEGWKGRGEAILAAAPAATYYDPSEK